MKCNLIDLVTHLRTWHLGDVLCTLAGPRFFILEMSAQRKGNVLLQKDALGYSFGLFIGEVSKME